jgi:N-acetyl-anhydromuramyl-L-alanine amidase AmpD
MRVLPSSPRLRAAVTGILMLLIGLSLVLGSVLSAGAVPSPAESTARLSQSPALRITATPVKTYRACKQRAIDTVVIHYASGINVDPDRWDDPALVRSIFTRYGVSAHYLIGRDGHVYKLVNEHDIAWHAGGSIMPGNDGRRNVNRFSIGIELIATATSGYTDAQYDALTQLIHGIRQRYPIRNLVGHDQIAGKRAVQLGLRKDVKPDPGPLFDWQRLRDALAE